MDELDYLERIDREVESSLEKFKEEWTCRKCVCYDGKTCDLDGEEKTPDDGCTEFEAWE